MGLLLASLFILSKASNLICNGDFQDQTIAKETYIRNDRWSATVSNDPRCWFVDSQSQNEYKLDRFYSLYTTQALALSTSRVCQDLEMVPQSDYQLKFDVYCKYPQTKVQYLFSINGNLLFFHRTSGINKTERLIQKLRPFQRSNRICFWTYTPKCLYGQDCSGISGLIDNISLIGDASSPQTPQAEAQNEVVVVHFITEADEQSGIVRLNSNLTCYEYLLSYLRQSLTVSIKDERQTQIHFEGMRGQNITVWFMRDKPYQLSTLTVNILNRSSREKMIVFEVIIEHGAVAYFQPLSNKEKQVIKSIKPVIEKMSATVKSVQSVMSTFICTYFILGLLNFWNVSLMYNFVMIRTVPGFARNIFTQILEFFYTNGDIFTWLPQSMQPKKDFILFTMQDSILQKMEENRQGFKWFRQYSFSSKIMNNNFQNFISFGLLSIRFMLLKLILKILSVFINRNLSKECNFRIAMIKEVLSMAPFFFISAFTVLLSPSLNFQECFEKIGQILIILTVIICYISFLISANNRRTKKKQDKSKLNERYCEFNEMLLGFSTPILVIVGSPLLLLIVNGLILVYTLTDLIRRFSKIDYCTRIFSTVRILIWLLFHGSFFVLYFLEDQINTEGRYTYQNSQIAIKCGFVALFCLLFGGAVELLASLAEVVLLLYRFFTQVCCYRSKDGRQQKEAPQTTKINAIDNTNIIPALKVEKQSQNKVAKKTGKRKKARKREKAEKTQEASGHTQTRDSKAKKKKKDKTIGYFFQRNPIQNKQEKLASKKNGHNVLLKLVKPKANEKAVDEAEEIEEIEVSSQFNKKEKIHNNKKHVKSPFSTPKSPQLKNKPNSESLQYKKEEDDDDIEEIVISNQPKKQAKGKSRERGTNFYKQKQ